MMLKANGEYLDFNDDIEVERQIKLFEEISTTDGDFSYQFELDPTAHNLKSLGFPFPDNNTKLTYIKIPSEVLSDDGLQLYTGFLRIEGITNVITVSFFSGNNNWFGLLSGPLTDIDFSDLDVDLTLSNLLVYANANEGIIFPVVDNGGLVTRSYRQMKLEDFVAGIYVKTVFKRIFQHHSIKIQGELLDDVTFNSIYTQKNGKSQSDIDDRSSFVHTSSSPNPNDGVYYKMTWDDDSNFPYFDGASNNFSLVNDRYDADVRMIVRAELNIYELTAPGLFGEYRVAFFVNGVLYSQLVFFNDIKELITYTDLIPLNAGDYLEAYTYNDGSVIYANPILNATLKITPTYIYKAFGNSVVPNWTQQEYVSNILRIFNVLTSYDSVSGTLTFNLFDKIKSKQSKDLSSHISKVEVDYTDFISDYGKKNLLSYNEVDFDNLKQYNVSNFFKYGQGVIESNNEFLPDSESIIESDFSNPIGYINPVFDMSMERLNLIELDEDDSVDATSVTDASGNARFNIPDDIFLDGDLVRVSDSTNENYNGDWVINTQSAGYIELYGVLFDTNATATITKLNYVYNNSDDVYLLWNIPFYQVTKFSGYNTIRWENADRTEVPVGYFSILNTGSQINTDFKQSLSFGTIENPLFYQRTLIDTYWDLFRRMLNDPVKLFATANIPYHIFLGMDFLSPIEVKTLETTNLYYQNRITGYRGSERDCIVELIKLP